MTPKLAPSRRALLRAAGGLALAAAAGCSLFTTAPPRLYTIAAPEPNATASGGALVAWQLAVAVPESPEALDTARIALCQGLNRVDYFADAAWPDRAPGMVRDRLIEALEATGRLPAVAREATGIAADFLLLTDLQDFQALYPEAAPGAAPSGMPEIEVRLGARLMRAADRRIVASTVFDQRRAATANSVDAVVAAFDAATASVLARVAAWTIQSGETAFRSAEAPR